MMDSSAILTQLRFHQGDLQARGVQHIAVFGSVATGQAMESSDVDVLVDLNPDMPMGIYDYVALKRFIAGLFPIKVDVVHAAALKQGLSPRVASEALYAF